MLHPHENQSKLLEYQGWVEILMITLVYSKRVSVRNNLLHSVFISISWFTGCMSEHPYLIGNGYCDDETNNEGCSYDGGDCCGLNVNTQYCSECLCFEQQGKVQLPFFVSPIKDFIIYYKTILFILILLSR